MPKCQCKTIRTLGDGRCLSRSVAHVVHVREGNPSPSESLQEELADRLRARVAKEFVKRKAETVEWFLEGDFEKDVGKMREHDTWGGEPELIMCSHVLL
ncbi:OVARIAN TUMOR DOMAIN-containing deubiquitinating enzyme 4-like [Punica granatum]|uniref:Ubiquitin thioesterase OTU n=1 Tax=Punica granatum TaxID=22663 RepID=A0A6P8CJY6_PUNGR|nr:OVARIAN TUMOR DOMAIN-containing deubiquitinating enzyme 4-like [Punica granatum]